MKGTYPISPKIVALRLAIVGDPVHNAFTCSRILHRCYLL